MSATYPHRPPLADHSVLVVCATPARPPAQNAVSNSADVLVLPSIRQADLSVAAELVEQLKQALPANGVVTDLVAAGTVDV